MLVVSCFWCKHYLKNYINLLLKFVPYKAARHHEIICDVVSKGVGMHSRGFFLIRGFLTIAYGSCSADTSDKPRTS